MILSKNAKARSAVAIGSSSIDPDDAIIVWTAPPMKGKDCSGKGNSNTLTISVISKKLLVDAKKLINI